MSAKNKIKTINSDLRNKVVYGVICILFAALISKAAYVSVVRGGEYSDIANNKIYRQITIEAPRGEIYDRNGILLAGSREAFAVEIYPRNMRSSELNQAISKVIEILEAQGEKIEDEFPIIIEEGQFEFVYDKNVAQWKQSNEIPADFTAAQTFAYMVEILSRDEVITVVPGDDNASLQAKIIEAGYYPPISVSKNEFSEIVKKQEWLTRYLEDYVNNEQELYSIDPKKAFQLLRKYFDIDASLSDEEARKVLNIRNLISQKGYYQYEPTTIAKDIKNSTVALIEENSINLKGISIVADSVRYYPLGNRASHILGQLGKISTQAEIDKYVKEKEYSPNDIIGKTGVEKSFEEYLRGENGYTQVQVDVNGRLVETLDRKEPKTGARLYLTLDINLQAVAEQALEKALQTIQTGRYYESEWGNMRMRDNQRIYNKATSGAVVVMDVKNGDILAMASYPDYDPNLFVQGISAEEFEKLTPANLNDPLAPKPLYNVATMTTVEPGSTFKMITGLTGIELGLSPYATITDKGVITMGGQNFGCWLWNQQRGTHGPENLMDALRDSCNYYFYSVATGYDYAAEKRLPIDIKVQDILECAKKFGLDENTGIEIEEISGKVPSVEAKTEAKRVELFYLLNRTMKTYFEDIESTSEKYTERIDTIIGWMEENPSRAEIIRRLEELKVKEEYRSKVADTVKYSYFNLAKWQTGDSFNLSIGQGDHRYSPIQMARYVSAIANNGFLNKVNIVGKIESSDKKESTDLEKISEAIPLKKPENLSFIRQGMQDVTDEGSASNYFRNYPVKVASKTGTAQKSGRIPVADEEAYLLQYLGHFGVNRTQVLELAEKLEKEDQSRLKKSVYLQRAILDLNPNMTIERLNQFKEKYDPFAWFVSYAPSDKPEIAVVTLIFQGGHGGYGAAIARDIYAEYFNLKGIEATDNIVNFRETIR